MAKGLEGADILVLPFGSVPLMTFLPDGDNDLAVCLPAGLPSRPYIDKIVETLEEEQGKVVPGLFPVQDVVVVNAEVQVVKCLVDGMMFDLSFNTLGGLRTLTFLEELDRRIGREHFLKNSIILVKAWCYYEGRLLGAHHGLISTYALEVLVLMFINLHHDQVSTPLQVLHGVLRHYAKFPFDDFCISIQGPIPLSSFPDPAPAPPAPGGPAPLLADGVLGELVAKYGPRGGGDTKRFGVKFFNVMDPLSKTNNLGRSVSRASLQRIRMAFTLAANKLDAISTLSAADEAGALAGLTQFFQNTLRSIVCSRTLSFDAAGLAPPGIEPAAALLGPPHVGNGAGPQRPRPAGLGDLTPLAAALAGDSDAEGEEGGGSRRAPWGGASRTR